MSINAVAISGNLTRDAELRQTGGGTNVLSFAVAVNERRKNQQSGEWEDYANFIDCTVFGARAQALAGYLTKGVKVAVSGHLHWQQWDAKDGSKRSRVSVIADEVDIMQKRQAQEAPRTQAADVVLGAYPDADIYAEDDIPF